MTTSFMDGDSAKWFGIETVTHDILCSSCAQFAGDAQCQDALYRIMLSTAVNMCCIF